MKFGIIKRKDRLTVKISGELDHHTARFMREEIDSAVELNMPTLLILDFKNISFMDSSGVGLVMGRYKLIAGKHKKLEVRNLSDRDYKIMKMSGIEKLAKISKKEASGRFGDAL